MTIAAIQGIALLILTALLAYAQRDYHEWAKRRVARELEQARERHRAKQDALRRATEEETQRWVDRAEQRRAAEAEADRARRAREYTEWLERARG